MTLIGSRVRPVLFALILCFFLVPLAMSTGWSQDTPSSSLNSSTLRKTPQEQKQESSPSSTSKNPLKTKNTASSPSSESPQSSLTPSSTQQSKKNASDPSLIERVISFFGIFALIGLAWLLSYNRSQIDWRLVGIGIGLQLFFAVFILITPFGRPIFDAATLAFTRLMSFTQAGSQMLFGGPPPLQGSLLSTVAFGILPTIIFFSSLMAIFYHLGIMQRLVQLMSRLMQKTMRTSGSETLSATANIFVGQTEAPLMIKPYIEKMTQSELMAVMVGGFATVAGGVLAIYVGFLEPYFPGIAGHLMAASVMSAPAALVIAKIIYPEVDQSPTRLEEGQETLQIDLESTDANLIDAAARGAGEGLTLMLNVAAMLLAFVALVAMVNYICALPSYGQHAWILSSLWDALQAQSIDLSSLSSCSPDKVAWEGSLKCIETLTPLAQQHQIPVSSPWGVLSLNLIFGYLFAPIAFVIGIPSSEMMIVGDLLGTKLVLNEFVAYQRLAELASTHQLSERSVLICNYALCGFANFGSIAIQIGGIGGIAPNRRSDLAKLGMRAMLGGTLAALMTATIAGVLL